MAKLRRVARTVALQTLTAHLLRREVEPEPNTAEILLHVLRECAPELKGQDEFAQALIYGVLEHRADLDGAIAQFAPEWPIEKLGALERVLLELGAFELRFEPETPLAVIINEWVDLAKEFGDETAGKFVNGVLSSIGHSVRAAAEKS